MRFITRSVYAITDPDKTPWHFKTLACQLRHIPWLQYRDKGNDFGKQLQQLRLLKRVCLRTQTQLVVNDNIRLARRCQVHSVHVGQQDSAQRINALSTRFVGRSCYNQRWKMLQAKKEGARYGAYGSVFKSLTKPHAVHAPIRLLRCSRPIISTRFKIVAIGGINWDNAPDVLRWGANYVAMIDGFWSG